MELSGAAEAIRMSEACDDVDAVPGNGEPRVTPSVEKQF